AGYNMAMNRYRANELMDGASKRAIVIASQLSTGIRPNLTEFEDENITAGGTFQNDVTEWDGEFGIKVSGVTKPVCQNLVKMIGDSTSLRAITKTNDETKNITPDECSSDDNELFLIYNNDMVAEDNNASDRTSDGGSSATTDDYGTCGKPVCYDGGEGIQDECGWSTCPYGCIDGSARCLDKSEAPTYTTADNGATMCQGTIAYYYNSDVREWRRATFADVNCMDPDGPTHTTADSGETMCQGSKMYYYGMFGAYPGWKRASWRDSECESVSGPDPLKCVSGYILGNDRAGYTNCPYGCQDGATACNTTYASSADVDPDTPTYTPTDLYETVCQGTKAFYYSFDHGWGRATYDDPACT
ncbi:MAG: hypothetical protein SPL08_02380, partial [Pseudomonadota bacterium]|nr:hypothetical protein [Pseudomonadota bacterium]